jgi:hypothetical protein
MAMLVAATGCQMAVVSHGKAQKTVVDDAAYVVYSVTAMTKTNIAPCDSCPTHKYMIDAYNAYQPNNHIYFTVDEYPEKDTILVELKFQ